MEENVAARRSVTREACRRRKKGGEAEGNKEENFGRV
jgi:hypothetical protein